MDLSGPVFRSEKEIKGFLLDNFREYKRPELKELTALAYPVIIGLRLVEFAVILVCMYFFAVRDGGMQYIYGLLGFLLLSTALQIYVIRFKGGAMKLLVRDGMLTHGVMLSYREAGEPESAFLRFAFLTGAGEVIVAEYGRPLGEVFSAGDLGPVLYLPNKPEKAWWLGNDWRENAL